MDIILHYLDDFPFGGKAGTMLCSDIFSVFQHSCKEGGMVPLADEKTVEPTEKLVFLCI